MAKPASQTLVFPPANPEVIYDLARDRLDRQLGAVDSMDTKLAGFFGVGTALFGVITALFAIKPEAFKAGGWVVLILAVPLFAALAVVCITGMRVRVWDIGPDMEDIYNDHLTFDETEIKWRTTSTLLKRHHTNLEPYGQKTATAKIAPLLLVFLAALTVAAAVSVAFQG